MMSMRFTILNSSRKRAPEFSAGRQKKKFLILAISEIATLTLLALLVLHFRSLSDPALIASGLLAVFGAISVIIRKSAIYAQFVFLVSLLCIELILLADIVPFTIQLSALSLSSSLAFPIIFIALDLAVLWWVVARGIFIDVNAEMTDE